MSMKYGEDYKKIPVYSKDSGKGTEFLPDVYVYVDQIVNVLFIGDPKEESFVIVDTGMYGRSDKIIEAAQERFGSDARPKAIILTHGHFDHVGTVIELVERWDVPVYAEEKEMPYLTGKKGYPEPDYQAEGGLILKTSKFFPTDPIELDDRIQMLPEDGTVPFLPEFRWLSVPGHTEGQIALFRERDRFLIAADAFVTTRQENLYDVLTQKEIVSGPPRYLTPDWTSAKESVIKLKNLRPEHAVTGHGHPMSGQELTDGLKKLIDHWEEEALPSHGKFVEDTEAN